MGEKFYVNLHPIADNVHLELMDGAQWGLNFYYLHAYASRVFYYR